MVFQISWFAVKSTSYVFFTGKALAFNLMTDPSYELIRWSSDFTTNLTQMTMISTTLGRNPSEEMKQPSRSTKVSEMQYLDAISKTTE